MMTNELAAKALECLEERGLTLATAESCTGGWLGKLLTEIPGSSAHYLGGIVSYTNSVKRALLGVDETVLQTVGAVSRSTSVQMARGVCNAIGADLGISITGLAGPNGDGSGKPVGLVYIALCSGARTRCRRLLLPGSREQVRCTACCEALQLLLEEIG